MSPLSITARTDAGGTVHLRPIGRFVRPAVLVLELAACLVGLFVHRVAGVLRGGSRLVGGFLGGGCGPVRRCLGVRGLLVVAAAHDGKRESGSYEERPVYHHRFP